MTDNYTRNQGSGLKGITLLFLAGVFAGSFLYSFSDSEKMGLLRSTAENLVTGRLDRSFAENVINSFSGPFILLFICFLLGLCAVAQPVEFLIPFFHGFGAGLSVAGIYDSYGTNGIGVAALLVVPGAVISAFALIVAVREAVNMSCDICRISFGKHGSGGNIDFRLYFIKFVILCAIITAASLVEGVMTAVFKGLLEKI